MGFRWSLAHRNDCGYPITVLSTDHFMTNKTAIRVFVCICVFGLIGFRTNAGGGIEQPHNGVVDFPPQIVQIKSGCLWIDGTLASGHFFDGLRRKQLDGLPQYTSGGKVLMVYPESVVASIRILNDQCVPDSADSQSSMVRDGALSAIANTAGSPIADGETRQLTFQIAWKDGLQLTPILLSPVDVHCKGSSSEQSLAQSMPAPPMTCQITIKSAGIPLSDHLVVSVFGPTGERLTRLSAAP